MTSISHWQEQQIRLVLRNSHLHISCAQLSSSMPMLQSKKQDGKPPLEDGSALNPYILLTLFRVLEATTATCTLFLTTKAMSVNVPKSSGGSMASSSTEPFPLSCVCSQYEDKTISHFAD